MADERRGDPKLARTAGRSAQVHFDCRVNRPYLELAMKLSAMSRDKLRSVAEDILDITL
ncbi:MAG: hypothetical protein U0V48_10335 [Anaerolineales bacterium]